MKLKTLTIGIMSAVPHHFLRPAVPLEGGGLLFHSNLAPSTVESLRLMGELDLLARTLRLSDDWCRLQSLVLRFPLKTSSIPSVVVLLKTLRCPALRDVTLELDGVGSIKEIVEHLWDRRELEPYKKLESTLLKFSNPRLVWMITRPLPIGRHSFWAQEFGKCLPRLSQRGALTVQSDIVPTIQQEDWICSLVVSPDSKWTASGSKDTTVILWDTNGNIAQQWVAHHFSPVFSLAFSPDSQSLVSGGNTVSVWDLSQGMHRRVARLEGHEDEIVRCAWSPDGDSIASGSDDGVVLVWDAHTFQRLHVFDTGSQSARLLYVTFSPDGHYLAAAVSRDWYDLCYTFWCPHRWDALMYNCEFIKRRDESTSLIAAYHPGSMRAALAYGSHAVKITEVRGTESRWLAAPGQQGGVNDVSFSPDGRRVLVASNDEIVRVWDVDGPSEELLQLQGHTEPVWGACFSPCGLYIASASWDGTVRLWRTCDGFCVATLSDPNLSAMIKVAFSPDGKTLWSASASGTVVVRRMRDIIPVDEQDSQ